MEKTSVLFDPNDFAPYDPSQEIIFPPELKVSLSLEEHVDGEGKGGGVPQMQLSRAS